MIKIYSVVARGKNNIEFFHQCYYAKAIDLSPIPNNYAIGIYFVAYGLCHYLKDATPIQNTEDNTFTHFNAIDCRVIIK